MPRFSVVTALPHVFEVHAELGWPINNFSFRPFQILAKSHVELLLDAEAILVLFYILVEMQPTTSVSTLCVIQSLIRTLDLKLSPVMLPGSSTSACPLLQMSDGVTV